VGLITDIQPPDLETRIAILRKKTMQERMSAPTRCWSSSPRKITSNIRELEGALIRVTAFASLNRQPVDMTLGRDRPQGPDPEGGEPEITAGLIMAQTAAYFGISLTTSGEEFGGRDHTTVMYAEQQDQGPARPSVAQCSTRSPSSPTGSRCMRASPEPVRA
jgi:chromosomal replication initiator protein